MRKFLVLAGAALLALLAFSASAAAHSTSCNSTLTNQAISGDLVVPDGGVCKLVNSTVGDDVWIGEDAYFQATGSGIGDHVEGNRSQTLFIDSGTTVGGDVEANRTAQVFVYNSAIDGRVEAWRSSQAVQICGNTIDGKVHVHNSGPDILIGDPLTVGCPGNTIENGHSMRVEDNTNDGPGGEFVVRGNTFQGGDLRVNDNSGPFDKFVQSNTGGDELECFGNEQPFTASGNTGWNELRGQCAIPPTECNGALTGQTITGDLTVPSDGACTLTNSTVGGDVKVGRNAFLQATSSQIGGDVKAGHALTVFIDTGTTVGGDVRTWHTDQVFLFNANLNGTVHVSHSSEKVQICGDTVDGFVHVHGSGTDILIGDPLTVGCPGNTIENGHSMRVEDNTNDGPGGEFVIRGNTFQGGDLHVSDNSGPFPKVVENNTGGGELECFGNEQPFTASGNTGWDELRGQCAAPPTTCETTLTNQTVPDDLVVPEDGVCRIVNTTVAGDVKVGRNAYFEAEGSHIGDDVYGKKSQTIYLHSGTAVGDHIHSSRTAQVFVFDATVNGRVEISGSTQQVQLCGSTIDGRVTVTDSGPDILVGDPRTTGCPGNTIKNGHSMTVEDNTNDGPFGEFVVRGNTFEGGDLRVNGNSGPFAKFVQDNTGGEELDCFGNEDPFTATGNSFVDEDGQCAEV